MGRTKAPIEVNPSCGRQEGNFMMIFYHATFTSMGFYWGTCFTRQNYSLTLNHVKHFPLFCHCYFLIFNYDLYYLLKPVKICFFWKKCHCIWSDIGPDMCLDLIPILAIQWWLQACSVLLFEFQKVALKRILGTFFSNFHQTSLERLCT